MTGSINRYPTVKTISVASGKGGVGKTNIAANIAATLGKRGKKVLIMDADLGLSNIDVLLRVRPSYSIRDLLNGAMALGDILAEGPHGIRILAAGSGVQELTRLDDLRRMKVLEAFDAFQEHIDVLIIDTAAGISENSVFFCMAAQEIVIVTSPEPTAISDTASLIRVLYARYREQEFHVLVNAAGSPEEALETYRCLTRSADVDPQISLDYLGCLPYDESVRQAVRLQQPFVDLYPRNPISLRIAEVAEKLLCRPGRTKGTLQFFMSSLLAATQGQVR